MAISKAFFSLRRGSTKTLTFQVLNGKQVTKDRVSQVANPKTEGQNIQRVLMANVMRAYSLMKGIADHSYEGVRYGANSQSKFLSLNVKKMRQQLTAAGVRWELVSPFLPLGDERISSFPYQLSSGSIGGVAYEISDNKLGIPDLGGATTYADYCSAMGVQAGDQLTFCIYAANQDGTEPEFIYSRIIMQPVDAFGNPLPLDSVAFTTAGVPTDNPRNEIDSRMSFSTGYVSRPSFVNFALAGAAANKVIISGAIIVSRQSSDGTWRRSSATMLPGSYPIGESIKAAITNQSAVLATMSARYLNNYDPLTNTAAVVPNVEDATYKYGNQGEETAWNTNETRTAPASGQITSFFTLNLDVPARAEYVEQLLVPTANNVEYTCTVDEIISQSITVRVRCNKVQNDEAGSLVIACPQINHTFTISFAAE